MNFFCNQRPSFLFSLPLFFALAVLASSCSSTSVTAQGADTLVIEHLSARDPLSGTWRIEGVEVGKLTPAENLSYVSTSGVAWGRLGQEEINPRRDLQGYIDRREAGKARINVRQRGLSRWDAWTFNGVYALDGSGEQWEIEPLPKLNKDALLEPEDAKPSWWNPRSWKLPSIPFRALN